MWLIIKTIQERIRIVVFGLFLSCMEGVFVKDHMTGNDYVICLQVEELVTSIMKMITKDSWT